MASDASLLAMLDEAQSRLQHLEISCRQLLEPTPDSQLQQPAEPQTRLDTSQSITDSDPRLLLLQVLHLREQLQTAVARREEQDLAFRQAAQYAAAKGSANGVLHALFDQVSAGKMTVLRDYLDTGSIPTRDGLRHWRLDLRTIRNEAGATLLHAAVGVSTARQAAKLKLVQLLVDRVGFDPNVRDVFGQTPLHVAAMGGFEEVVGALLERGADPLAQDRAGLTPLLLVRTLSRPPEEVVQALLQAEKAATKGTMLCMKSSLLCENGMDKVIFPSPDVNPGSSLIPLHKAVASALFLKSLHCFGVRHHSSALARQTTTLINTLMDVKDQDTVPFDQLLQERVPLLFEILPTNQVARLDTIFSHAIYRDPVFLDDFKVEAAGYGLSLVSPSLTTAAGAGPTWVGVLLKLIQCLKVEAAKPVADARTLVDSVEGTSSAVDGTSVSKRVTSPPHKASVSVPSSMASVDSQLTVYYADESVAKTRQVWYYAILFKAATHALPGTLTVQSESDTATSSDDISKYFPLEDRLAIGAEEFFATGYDAQTRQIQLDRKYKGSDATGLKAYLTGSYSSALPPYIAVKRIWEREPGNKYEDQMSNEQELFQDYQFMDPESEYEVAIKLGPLPNSKVARAIVAEWKRQVKELFDLKRCKSKQEYCEHYCPQRDGHSLCLGSMAAIGQQLAKARLGRPTFSKPMKPRASLQKLQDRFKGSKSWPGSPAKVEAVALSSPP